MHKIGAPGLPLNKMMECVRCLAFISLTLTIFGNYFHLCFVIHRNLFFFFSSSSSNKGNSCKN